MSKKIAVILAGCGVYDGAEIHEATLTLYAISRNGASYDIFAPDMEQAHVVNHLTGEEMNEKRNVLIEAARIARGKISPLSDFNSDNYDAIIFPGGFGAAKNLCTFAFDGPDCTVNLDVERVIKDMHTKGKTIAALCISPVIIAKVLGNVQLTIGQDEGTAKGVEALGAKHIITNHGEVVIDAENKIITTPCYMLDATIAQIGEGAENVVQAILKM